MRRSVALVLTVLFLTGCSGSITSSTEMVFDPPDAQESDEVVEATFTMVRDQILTPSCALSGCHADFEFPRLTSAQAYAGIVGVPSSSGLPLIDPGAPATSYLYLKVIDDDAISGGVMPRGGPQLSPTQIELLRTWIERGALND